MAWDIVEVEDLTPYLLNRVLLSPALWERYQVTSPRLDWKEVKFSSSSISMVPPKRGVYAFLIRNSTKKAAWPQHGYIMYIGIAGKRNTDRTLRERFSEYLSPAELRKRDKLSRLVKTWDGHLYFNYAVVSRNANLEKVETTLLGSVVPPCNRGDLPIEIRGAVNAFF